MSRGLRCGMRLKPGFAKRGSFASPEPLSRPEPMKFFRRLAHCLAGSGCGRTGHRRRTEALPPCGRWRPRAHCKATPVVTGLPGVSASFSREDQVVLNSVCSASSRAVRRDYRADLDDANSFIRDAEQSHARTIPNDIYTQQMLINAYDRSRCFTTWRWTVTVAVMLWGEGICLAEDVPRQFVMVLTLAGVALCRGRNVRKDLHFKVGKHPMVSINNPYGPVVVRAGAAHEVSSPQFFIPIKLNWIRAKTTIASTSSLIFCRRRPEQRSR